VQLHGPFYAAVQGLLYLICYKHELLQGVSQLPDGHGFVKRDDSSSSQRSVLHEVGLSLHDVLHGPLNPLKFCLEAIAIEFERLAICDVSELLDANERVVVASNTMGGLRNQLEDFFPFDPLHGFKQMSALIAPFYQEWRAQRDSEARDSNLSALSRSVDDDHALSHSLQGMSVTPTSAADEGPLEGPVADHMRRRLHESKSVISRMLAGAPQVHQAGFSPEYQGARAGRPEQIAPLSLPVCLPRPA